MAEGKLFEINRDGQIQHTIELTINEPHPHRDTRLVRRLRTATIWFPTKGTESSVSTTGTVKSCGNTQYRYLRNHVLEGTVRKRLAIKHSAPLRLPNGNTLIGTGNGHSVLEVDHDKNIVWKLDQNDLEDITLAWVTTLEVHPNGTS